MSVIHYLINTLCSYNNILFILYTLSNDYVKDAKNFIKKIILNKEIKNHLRLPYDVDVKKVIDPILENEEEGIFSSFRKLMEDCLDILLENFRSVIQNEFQSYLNKENDFQMNISDFLFLLNPVLKQMLILHTSEDPQKDWFNRVKEISVFIAEKQQTTIKEIQQNIYSSISSNDKIITTLNFLITSYILLLINERFSIIPIPRILYEDFTSYHLFSPLESINMKAELNISEIGKFKQLYIGLKKLRECDKDKDYVEHLLIKRDFEKFSQRVYEYYERVIRKEYHRNVIEKNEFIMLLKIFLDRFFNIYVENLVKKPISRLKILENIIKPGFLGEAYVYNILRYGGFLVFPRCERLYICYRGSENEEIWDKEVDGIILIPYFIKNRFIYKIAFYEVTISLDENKIIKRAEKLDKIISMLKDNYGFHTKGLVFTLRSDLRSQYDSIKFIVLEKISDFSYLISNIYDIVKLED